MEVYQLFNEELNLVKKEFNTKTVDLPPMYPNYAGSAAWARMLKRRIDRPMNVNINRGLFYVECFVPESINSSIMNGFSFLSPSPTFFLLKNIGMIPLPLRFPMTLLGWVLYFFRFIQNIKHLQCFHSSFSSLKI